MISPPLGTPQGGFDFNERGMNEPLSYQHLVAGSSGWSFSAILLPLRPPYASARVMILGWGLPQIIEFPGLGRDQSPPTTWRPAAGATYQRRRHGIATLLPNGRVLMTGGTSSTLDRDSVLWAEEFDPEKWDPQETDPNSMRLTPEQRDRAQRPWRVLARARVRRNYHSVALLLPDGRVWTAGSNYDGQQNFRFDRNSPFEWQSERTSQRDRELVSMNLPPIREPNGAPHPQFDRRELRIELFSPPYMFAPNRPRIDSAPGVIPYYEPFVVTTRDAATITKVVLMRCGSVTHGFDGDQRYVELNIFWRGEDRLMVDGPPNRGIVVAPPGPYMLFVVREGSEEQGDIPSVGRMVRVG